MNPKLKEIHRVWASGDSDKATQMLRWVLKNEPSADAWTLAAELTQDTEMRRQFLRKAVALDEWHTQANRMLREIEGAVPKDITPPAASEWQNQAGEKDFHEIQRQGKKDRFQLQAERQRFYTRMGCTLGIFFSFFFSIAVMRAIGFVSTGGLSNMFARFSGNPTPVASIQGTPLANVDNAALVMVPSMVEAAVSQDVEIIDNGYLHEHFFEGYFGQEYAIYVQFMSVSAANVKRNVVIVSPGGVDKTKKCNPSTMLQDSTNVTFLCVLDESGRWAVRVLGREGESVGAYFIGVEQLLVE